MNNKLKIGLLIDSTNIPYCIFNGIFNDKQIKNNNITKIKNNKNYFLYKIYTKFEKINQSNYAQINLLIINGNKQIKNNNITKIKNNKNYFLYKIYTKFENKIYKQESNTFETYDLESILLDTNKITVIPKQTKYSDLIEEEDVKKIKEFDLDVIVRLGFRILRGGILKAAKCGVWSFHHGDNNINRGGPAGFWEVFEKHPVTGSILQIITEELDDLYRRKIIWEKNFRGSSLILPICKYLGEIVKQRYPDKKVEVMYQGIDPLKWYPEKGMKLKHPCVNYKGKILTKSYSTTDPILVKRNCNNYYMKTLSFLPRKLKELQELGQERFLENVEKENENLRFYSNRLYNRGGPAGFWEVFEKHPVTGSILQIITEELDEGKILTKSYSTTDPILVKRNCNNYYMKTLSFLPRKLKELQELGQERFLENVEKENENLRFYSNRLYTRPTNIEFLRLWYSNFGKFIKEMYKIHTVLNNGVYCLI